MVKTAMVFYRIISTLRRGVHIIGASSFLFAMLLFCATPASAVEGAGAKEASGIEALVAYAAEHNPSLKAARLDWLRSLQRAPQVSSWDDPVFSYTYPIEPIETRLGPQEHILSLSQSFPFPGKLGLKADVAGKEAEAARLRYEKALRDVAFEVRRSCYELFYYSKALELAKEQMDVFDSFIKAEMSDYAVGSSGLNDVVDAESRYADASNDLVTYEDLKDAERTRLNTLLGRGPEESVEGLDKEPEMREIGYSLDELYEGALKSAEVEIAQAEVEKSALEMDLARYSSLPDFRLGVNYSVIGTPEMSVRDAGRDAASVTFGITIPLWFGKNSAAREQASLGTQMAGERRQSAKDAIRGRVKKIYAEARTNGKLVKLYSGSLLPRSRELIKIAEIKYRNGEGGIAGVFNAQTMWLNFSMAYYRALATYLEKTAELESLTGTAPGPTAGIIEK